MWFVCVPLLLFAPEFYLWNVWVFCIVKMILGISVLLYYTSADVLYFLLLFCYFTSFILDYIYSMEQIILYHSSSLRFLKYNFGDVWKIPYSHTIYIKLRYWMLLKRFWHEPTFSEFSFSTSWSMSHCIVLKRLILKICNCRCCVELWRWEIEKKV